MTMQKTKTALSNLQLEILRDVLMLNQESLHIYCRSFFTPFYGKKNRYEAWGEGMYFKGDIPVLLVAHMDTVHKVLPTEMTLFHDQEKDVMWCPDGLGADCRAGVFNIIDIVGKGYKPHIMLTWDEEIGGVGASKLMDRWASGKGYDSEAVKQGMSEVNFAVQLDRQGYSEAVYYDLDNPEFEEYISSFGYNTKIGSFTDICEICPAFGFAGVNVSAGYVREHTSTEVLLVEEMLLTQDKVLEILKDQQENPKFFKYEELPGGYGSYGSFWRDSSWDSFTDLGGYDPITDLQTSEDACSVCGSLLDDTNWHKPVKDVYQSDACYACRVDFWDVDAEVPKEFYNQMMYGYELSNTTTGAGKKKNDK